MKRQPVNQTKTDQTCHHLINKALIGLAFIFAQHSLQFSCCIGDMFMIAAQLIGNGCTNVSVKGFDMIAIAPKTIRGTAIIGKSN